MKKINKLFAIIITLATLFTCISFSCVSAENDQFYYENFKEVDMGTFQIRKGGYKKLDNDGGLIEVVNIVTDNENIIKLDRDDFCYNAVGIENGTATVTLSSLFNSTNYIWTFEVSDQFSTDLKLSDSEYTLPLDTKSTKIINIVDPYDDSWYNSFKGESIYNDNAKWSSDNESVVTVKYGHLSLHSVGTATVTAEFDGVTYECIVTVTEPEPIKGDADLDDVLSLYDVIAIAKHIMGLEILSDSALAKADYNGDGIVDLHDAIEIARTLLP